MPIKEEDLEFVPKDKRDQYIRLITKGCPVAAHVTVDTSSCPRRYMGVESVDFILKNLSRSERDEFLRELLLKSNLGELSDIIYGWEATAELNSVPKMKAKIKRRSKSLNRFLSGTS